MNKKQYNNVIEHTLKNELSAQTEDSLAAARAIFNNMGVALPEGDMKHVYEVIKSDDYMGWKSCTKEEAQEAANNGTAAIGISEDRIVVLAAVDEEEPVEETAAVMVLSENTTAYAVEELSYYSYSNGTTVVVKESVLITKDGNYNKVIFESTGKIWYCINHDLIYDEEYSDNETLKKRAAKNLFVYYNEDDPLSSDTTIRKYTDQEIRLLYAIDPYGVARYVQSYTVHLDGGLEEILRYKDRIFKLLYGREPNYFARGLDGVWYITSDRSNLSAVLSESEAYFGMHPIYDELTFLNMVMFVVDVVGFIIGKGLVHLLKVSNNTKRAGVISQIIFSAGDAVVKDELGSYANDTLMGIAIDRTELDWANSLVSYIGDLTEIIGSTMVEPNFYKHILNYCANDTNYNVYIELYNGRRHKIDDVCEAINK